MKIPDTCWTIDPLEHPFVDIIVDIAPVGFGAIERKSVVMVRSILDDSHKSRYCHMGGGQQDLVASLKAIGNTSSLSCGARYRLAQQGRTREMLV